MRLLNAAHMRNVPGRKTDVSDSAWIAQLVEHGQAAAADMLPSPLSSEDMFSFLFGTSDRAIAGAVGFDPATLRYIVRPRVDQIEPAMLGVDWLNCFVIAVKSPVGLSTFVYVGENLSFTCGPDESLAGCLLGGLARYADQEQKNQNETLTKC